MDRDGPGLVNSVRLGSLWRWCGKRCSGALSGFIWAWVACGTGLF